MGNKPKPRLEREKLKIEKAFPSHKLCNMNNLTYLLKPELLEELHTSSKSKILRKIQDDCTQALQELAHVMQFLPRKQSSEVLTSREFEYFMTLVQDFRFLDKKVQNEYAQTLYSNFIQIGLRGISNSMPRQFSLVVQEMIRPILQLLIAISETEIKGIPKLTDSFKKEVLGKKESYPSVDEMTRLKTRDKKRKTKT